MEIRRAPPAGDGPVVDGAPLVRFLSLATILSLGASLASGMGPRAHFPLLAGTLWLAALVVLLLEGLRGVRFGRPRRLSVWVAVVLACALAVILRIFGLSRIPAILTGNEAGFGLSALDFLRGEHTNLFDVGYWSFPALYTFIESLSLRLVGATVFGLRLPSVLIGALGVAATFAFASKCFGRTIGLASAFFLAAFGLHIHFSRLALNNIWESLFSALLALTLAIAWESKDRFRFILTGLVLGLMQYFYVGGRVFLILVPLWILLAASGEGRLRRARLERIGVVLWAAAVVVLPLALFYLRHPAEFMLPWKRVSLFWYWWDIQTITYGDPWWWVVWDQLIKAPLGFVGARLTGFYTGPLLTPLAVVLFVVGLAHLVRHRRDASVLWLGLWLIGTMVTVSLSSSPPAGQRYIGAAPAVAVLVALGAEAVVRRASSTRPMAQRFRVALLAGLLVTAAAWELHHYYINPSTLQDFNDLHIGEAARAAQALAEEEHGHAAFFFVLPGFHLAQDESIRFLAPTLTAHDVPDSDDWQITLDPSHEYSLFFLPGREDDLAAVQACQGGGEVSRVTEQDGDLLFVLYRVQPRRSATCSAYSTGAVSGDGS